MPVLKCPSGKYRIGTGKCVYNSKEKAERAYRGYLYHKHVAEQLISLAEQLLNEKKEFMRGDIVQVEDEASEYIGQLGVVTKISQDEYGQIVHVLFEKPIGLEITFAAEDLALARETAVEI